MRLFWEPDRYLFYFRYFSYPHIFWSLLVGYQASFTFPMFPVFFTACIQECPGPKRSFWHTVVVPLHRAGRKPLAQVSCQWCNADSSNRKQSTKRVYQPHPSPLSKWRRGRRWNPRQGCHNTPRIVEWHTMKWRFQRFFPAVGSRVCFLVIWNHCLIDPKTILHVLRNKTHWGFLRLPRHVENGEGRGKEIEAFPCKVDKKNPS